MNLSLLSTVALYRRILELLGMLMNRTLRKQLPRLAPLLVSDLQSAAERLRPLVERAGTALPTNAGNKHAQPDETQVETVVSALRRTSRAVLLALETIEQLRDESERAPIAALRTLLFPTSTVFNREKRQSMASAALDAELRLTRSVRAQLKALRLGDRTLLSLVEEWIEAGHTLDRALRAIESAKASSEQGEIVVPEEIAARHEAVAALRVVFHVLKREQLDETTRQSLMQGFHNEIANLESKRALLKERDARKAAGENDDDDEQADRKPVDAENTSSRPADNKGSTQPVADAKPAPANDNSSRSTPVATPVGKRERAVA